MGFLQIAYIKCCTSFDSHRSPCAFGAGIYNEAGNYAECGLDLVFKLCETMFTLPSSRFKNLRTELRVFTVEFLLEKIKFFNLIKSWQPSKSYFTTLENRFSFFRKQQRSASLFSFNKTKNKTIEDLDKTTKSTFRMSCNCAYCDIMSVKFSVFIAVMFPSSLRDTFVFLLFTAISE